VAAQAGAKTYEFQISTQSDFGARPPGASTTPSPSLGAMSRRARRRRRLDVPEDPPAGHTLLLARAVGTGVYRRRMVHPPRPSVPRSSGTTVPASCTTRWSRRDDRGSPRQRLDVRRRQRSAPARHERLSQVPARAADLEWRVFRGRRGAVRQPGLGERQHREAQDPVHGRRPRQSLLE
jgi:hypothetical protein